MFLPTWNRLNIGASEVDLDIPEHRLAVSYGRVLMFFKSSIRCEDDTFQEESLAYIEEYWEYTKNVNSSLVGTGNLQLYAPQVFYVIPIERILCKAEIMRDPVTPTIPAGALPTMQSRREREYLHAKKDRPGRLGSEKIHLQLLAHSMGSSSGEATDIGRAAGVCD